MNPKKAKTIMIAVAVLVAIMLVLHVYEWYWKPSKMFTQPASRSFLAPQAEAQEAPPPQAVPQKAIRAQVPAFERLGSTEWQLDPVPVDLVWHGHPSRCGRYFFRKPEEGPVSAEGVHIWYHFREKPTGEISPYGFSAYTLLVSEIDNSAMNGPILTAIVNDKTGESQIRLRISATDYPEAKSCIPPA